MGECGVCVAQVTWGMLFEGNATGSGFDHVPGGDAFKNRSAFSFHYYCSSFVPDYANKPIQQKVRAPRQSQAYNPFN